MATVAALYALALVAAPTSARASQCLVSTAQGAVQGSLALGPYPACEYLGIPYVSVSLEGPGPATLPRALARARGGLRHHCHA